MATSSTPGADDIVRGVPLAQLAAIHVGLAEGFELDEVLNVEELPRTAWFEAEASWKARLVSDDAVMDRYRAKLFEHQDRVPRSVTPLEDELESWMLFLRCYAEHRDPFDLLQALDLCLNDMARLGRHWNERFDREPKLAKLAAKLSLRIETRVERGEHLRIPPIEVSRRRLVASPVAGTFAAEATPESIALPVSAPVLGLDQYAALSAELRLMERAGQTEVEHAAVLARFGVDARHARAIDEAWRARLSSDPELRADFRVLVGHYEKTAALRRAAALRSPSGLPPLAPHVSPARPQAAAEAFLTPLPIHAPPESVPAPRSHAGTVMAHASVLPFRGSIRSMPRAVPTVPPPRPSGDIDGTSDIIPTLRDSDTLPFDNDGASALLDGTMMLGAITFDDDPLPFAGHTAPPALSDVTVLPGSLSFDDVDRPSVDSTMGAMFGGPWTHPPFSSVDSFDGSGSSDSLVVTLSGEHLFSISDDTPDDGTDLDATTILGVLNLDDQPATPPPALTLEQLASLHAELVVSPHLANDIRSRYHLPDLAHQKRTESFWFERFSHHPHEKRLYAAKVAEFRRWLVSQRR